KPSHEQIVQPVIELDLAPPAFHAFGDLIVRSPIVVDRALQQQLSLTLRRHLIQTFDFMFRQNIGRRRLRLALKAEKLLRNCAICCQAARAVRVPTKSIASKTPAAAKANTRQRPTGAAIGSGESEADWRLACSWRGSGFVFTREV